MGRKSQLKREARQPGAEKEVSNRLTGEAEQADTTDPEELEPGRMPPGAPKLSERILALLEPLIHGADTDERFEALVASAALAWDLSLLPEDKWPSPDVIGREVWAGTKPIVRFLVDRKNALFPDDQRFITSFEVAGKGISRRLNIGYTHLERKHDNDNG